ncbi:hypothetical protein MANI_009002 [Metarhizium anisopliae]
MNYSILPTAEGDIPSEREQRKCKGPDPEPNVRRRIVLLSLLALATLVIALASFAYDSQHVNTALVESCGGSPEEATSLGCSFDVMSFAWLPSRCFDQELMLDFLHLRRWQWFTDADGRHPIDQATVAKGTYEHLYVTQEYHMYHCTYMWRKMHRAVQHGQPLDGYIGSLAHTDHCESVLVHPDSSWGELTTSIFSKYVKCPWGTQNLERDGWYRIVNGTKVVGFGNH